MDPIKDAFIKIKEDINFLKEELNNLKFQINNLSNQTVQTDTSTQQPFQTDSSTDNQTVPYEVGGLYHPNLDISTGNKGVQTDKPTDRQTNQQTDNQQISSHNTPYLNDFERAKEALDSLDSVKRSLRLKFKKLTNQEMLVFSTLYSLEEQGFDEISYKMLSNNLNLSESSIRDYINKISKKGIPLNKKRHNNKQITISISPNLKEIATLSTINRLRDI